MKTPFSQQGLSMTGWLAVLFVVGIFVTCAVKITPLYIDSWTAQTAIENVVEDQQGKTQPISAIRSSLSRQFIANRIEVLNAKKMKISKKKGKIVIDARYEKRVPLFYNIDVVVKFDQLIYEIVPSTSDE
ncbi:DUF4845 domain-containing protein [Deltaproteobacteria bacterium]|nr:DUF4845 domain-containing protein [Deltaproteobacteria bacterium]